MRDQRVNSTDGRSLEIEVLGRNISGNITNDTTFPSLPSLHLPG